MWGLKDQGEVFYIRWPIFKICRGCSLASKSCNLCLLGELKIYNFKGNDRFINTRLTSGSYCSHENEYILAN